MRFLLLVLTALPLMAQVNITGTFKTPAGVGINGKVQISVSRPSATNLCASPSRVVSLRAATLNIISGVLQSTQLYATSCLSPSVTYTVRVMDSFNTLLYQSQWVVPNTGSANAASLDINLQ